MFGFPLLLSRTQRLACAGLLTIGKRLSNRCRCAFTKSSRHAQPYLRNCFSTRAADSARQRTAGASCVRFPGRATAHLPKAWDHPGWPSAGPALASFGDEGVTARANELLQRADGGDTRAARRLEKVTARSVASAAVKGGESVSSVANRMGISSPDLLAQLETQHQQGQEQIIQGAQELPPIIE